MTNTQECFKPHPTAHLVTGLGLGLILGGLGLTGGIWVVAGLILIVASFVWHFSIK